MVFCCCCILLSLFIILSATNNVYFVLITKLKSITESTRVTKTGKNCGSLGDKLSCGSFFFSNRSCILSVIVLTGYCHKDLWSQVNRQNKDWMILGGMI